MDELELLTSQRPTTPVPDAESTAVARTALVRHVEARLPETARPLPRRPGHVVLTLAAGLALVLATVGALRWLPGTLDEPPVQTTVALAAPAPEAGATYALASAASPDLPPDLPPELDEPLAAGVDLTAPLLLVGDAEGGFRIADPGPGLEGGSTDLVELTAGQAPFRLQPPSGRVEVGERWRYDAAPLQVGGEQLDGTCAATLGAVAQDGTATVEAACSWEVPGAGSTPAATSQETWRIDADGHLLSWRQTLTPTGSSEPGITTLTLE